MKFYCAQVMGLLSVNSYRIFLIGLKICVESMEVRALSYKKHVYKKHEAEIRQKLRNI